MTKDLPPEERLLRLIRGIHKKDIPSEEKLRKPETGNQKPEIEKEAPEKEEPKPRKAAVPISIGAEEKRLEPFKLAIFLFIGLFAIGILYFSYELFGQRQKPPIIDIEKLIPAEEKQGPIAEKEGEIPEEEEEPPVVRELFGAPVTRETPPLAEESPSLSELAKDLVLVGVISGDDPQAIIEDKRTRQTFYAYEGERVLEFKVKRIEKATVILEYNEETLKLSL